VVGLGCGKGGAGRRERGVWVAGLKMKKQSKSRLHIHHTPSM
jgi:hypothetical protein